MSSLGARLALSLYCASVCAQTEKAAQPKKPTVFVTADKGLPPGLNAAEFETFRRDIQAIAERLVAEGDPNLEIRIGTELSSVAVESQANPRGATINIQPGYFSFARNLSEVGAILSHHIARLKFEYEAELGRSAVMEQVPKGANSSEWIRRELDKIDKNPDAQDNPKREVDLRIALKFSEQVDRYEARVKNKNLREVMAQAGFKIDLSDESERNIRASLDAVDRMVRGGFDPWGLLSPLGRIERAELPKRGLVAIVRREGKPERAETINTELEFMKNYLLWLEAKKVDILKQPFYHKPLTREQAKIQRRALALQMLKMGPAMRESVGALATTMIAGAVVYFGADKASELFSKAKSSIAEEREEPVVREEIEKIREGLPPELQKPGALKSMVLNYLEQHTGKTLIGLGVATLYRLVFAKLQRYYKTESNKFLYRYRTHLQAQTSLSLELMKQKSAGNNDVGALVKLAEHQAAASDFLSDGRDPKDGRTRARQVYRRVYEASLATRLTDRDHPERLTYFNQMAQIDLGEDASKPPSPAAQKLGRELAKEMLFEHPNLSIPLSLVAGAEIINTIDRNLTHSKDYQKRLFNMFGIASEVATNHNSATLLNLIAERIERGGLNEEQKNQLREALMKLGAVEWFGVKSQALYAKTVKTAFPELAAVQTLNVNELQILYQSGKISEQLYLGVVLAHRNSGNLSPQQKFELFVWLVSKNKYTDALRYLTKNLKEVAGHVYGKTATEADRTNFHQTVGKILTNSYKLDGYAWTRKWMRQALFLKTLSLDTADRAAMGSQLLAHDPTWRPTAGTTLKGFYTKIISSHLEQIESAKELTDALSVLSTEKGADNKFLADYFLKRLKAKPQMIQTPLDAKAIADHPVLWHKLDAAVGSGPSWEQKMVQRYQDYAKRYPSFGYNANHSEQLQRVIIDRYTTVNPNATVEERLELWRGLANRGPTGPTDHMFERLFDDIKDPAKRQAFAEDAIANGLIWDSNIKAELYRSMEGSKLDAQSLAKAAEARTETFLKRLAQTLNGPSTWKRSWVEQFLKDIEKKPFQDPKAKAKIREELRTLVGKSMQGDTSSEGAYYKAENFVNRHRAALLDVHRIEELRSNIERLKEFFPETGHAFLELVNWISAKTQTRHVESRYLKSFLTENQNKNQDLGFSVINEVIQDALKWDRVEQWKLVRWLRGTGPVPDAIARSAERVGTETVRRLYATLPIFVRQGLMGALISAPKRGILSGIGKHLYYEQILNEILPAEKQSAGIASELLVAFLKSVEKVSHPEKRNSVLSYLLANHKEDASVGSVLRNVLEAYGVTGIKLAQLLAASDIMPEEIRRELAKTRDRAREPMRHEIFERLVDVLDTKDIDSKMTVQELLGAASVKYAIKVLDKKGGTHVIQIKREEAEASISRDFEQLSMIVEDLIAKNKARYAFLRGMVEAVKAAIWRELSLVRESKKTDIAKEEYKTVRVAEGIEIQIPANSKFVEDLGGPKSRFFYLRSSEFAPGQGLDKLEPEVQKKLAKALLVAEYDLLFPKDGKRTTHFDPDRHPGNVIWDVNPNMIGFSPIDWGQLLELKPEARARIFKLMSYSQIFEHVGVQDAVFEKFVAEFGIEESKRAGLKKSLGSFFPNSSGQPRSTLTPYYFMLSEMETAGFVRSIVNYDFIKAIYQLEAYEGLVAEEKHESPKKRLAAEVEAETKRISEGLEISKGEAIKYAILNPRAALTVKRNSELIKEGKLALDTMLGNLGVSQHGRDEALKHAPESFENAQKLVEWVFEQASRSDTKMPDKDRSILIKWQSLPEIGLFPLQEFTAKDFMTLGATNAIRSKIADNSVATRRPPLKQPHKQGFIKMAGNVYGAELINAIFWALYDRDPAYAQTWGQQMLSLDKHLGFAAFATSSSFYSTVTNKFIPMSYRKVRYFNQGGISMAVGMVASDIAHRIYAGQSAGQIADHLASKEHLKDLTFGVATFMVSEAVVDKAMTRLPCAFYFKDLARLSAVFVGASALDRTLREPLTHLGVLERSKLQDLSDLGAKHYAGFATKLDEIRAHKAKGRLDLAFKAFTGTSWRSAAHVLSGYLNNETKKPIKIFWDLFKSSQVVRATPGSFYHLQDNYLGELRALQLNTHDTFVVEMIEKEISMTRDLYLHYGKELFENESFAPLETRRLAGTLDQEGP